MTGQTIKPGDMFEIATEHGSVIVQVTHWHGPSAEVVRVLPAGSGTLDVLAAQRTLLVAMTPLASAIECKRLDARRIGNGAIPESARAFPRFRMAIRDKKDGVRGKVAYWWFWDGDGLTYSEDPPDDLESMPMREVLAIDEFLRRAALAVGDG